MRGLPPNHRKNAESAFRPWTDKMSNRHEALRGLAHYAQPDWEHLEDGRVQRLVVGQVDETVAQSWNTDRLPSRKRFLPDETLQTVLRRVRIAMEHPWEE